MTVAEVLKQSGLTDEQIAAIDAKAMSAFSGVLTTADQAKADALKKEQEATAAAAKAEADRKAAEESAAAAKAAQDAAELSQRTVKEFWENTYNPGIAAAEADKAKLAKEAADAKAEAAFYKAQRESYLGTLNIKPEDAPVFTPAKVDPVVDPNKTPGTPVLVDTNKLMERMDRGIYSIQDIGWQYQRLYGTPIPMSPSELTSKAEALKLSPMEFASRTFKFAEKEAERQAAAAKAHDDEVAAKAIAEKETAHKAEIEKIQSEFNAKEKLRAEQNGSNPDTKLPPGSAKFTELKKAVQEGTRPDPTKMSQQERRQLTLNNIHKAMEERQTAVA